MNHPSLEARHVSRAFGSLKAVDGVSLSIEAGQVVALLGQSGSGKSTLLRILAGLEGLDSGEVFAAGELVASPARITPPEQRGLGMVFQDYALFPHLSAVQNVAFGLLNLGKTGAKQSAFHWLEKVGLSSRANYFPHQLSGGEQQRVALARALAPQPRAVLMDEPFSGLDPHLRADLQRTMLDTLRTEGVAALIVSHDTEEALGIADQVAIMDQGRIIQAGVPGDVYQAPVSLEAARALGPVWTSTWRADGAQVETPFGNFPTHLTGMVKLAARPDATVVTPNDTGVFTVTLVRGVGRYVTVTLQGQDCLVQAVMPRVNAPEVGSRAAISLAPPDAFLFQGGDSHIVMQP
jgi:iron(III) transport system ATP-binding protein